MFITKFCHQNLFKGIFLFQKYRITKSTRNFYNCKLQLNVVIDSILILLGSDRFDFSILVENLVKMVSADFGRKLFGYSFFILNNVWQSWARLVFRLTLLHLNPILFGKKLHSVQISCCSVFNCSLQVENGQDY